MPRPPIAPALIAYALDPCAYAVFASPSALAVCSPTLNVSDSYRCTHSRTQLAAENLFLRKQLALYLERQVTLAARLSCHLVQGHVDATGEVAALDPLGDGNWRLKVRVPEEIGRYLIYKGSIALDGISLTIAALEPGPVVAVAIIPHTFANTTIGSVKPGARVNIEVDMLAKYIEKLLKAES